jgi:hypothetical protein
MATLRHIALISPDPKLLSDFYQRAAGVECTEEPPRKFPSMIKQATQLSCRNRVGQTDRLLPMLSAKGRGA